MRAGAALIDIRGDTQIARDGNIPGALVIARNVLEWRLDPDSQHRHRQGPGLGDHVILLCDEGYQSSLAAATLQQLGFACATDVDGGFQAWRKAGLPVILPVGPRQLDHQNLTWCRIGSALFVVKAEGGRRGHARHRRRHDRVPHRLQRRVGARAHA
jgi:rhodanese-related sulfurtransferase